MSNSRIYNKKVYFVRLLYAQSIINPLAASRADVLFSTLHTDLPTCTVIRQKIFCGHLKNKTRFDNASCKFRKRNTSETS